MRFSNLHTHTTFSDGTGTPRENVESAIKKNMLSLGFSDHSFTACDTSYCMKLSEYARYRSEIRELKGEYSDRIPIFLGLEKDYYSDIQKDEFDYVIASVHYIIRNGICYPIDHSEKQQRECINDAFSGSTLDMAKCYFDMVTEHAIKSKPDIIGHFDVITKFSIMPEEDEHFIELGEESVKEIIKHCPRFEVNTGGIARGWRKTPYPSLNLMHLISELGGELVLNSDSHKPENLDFYFEESLPLIRKAGITQLSVLGENGFSKLNI